MIKAKTCRTQEGKYVVKVRFLFMWWRAVEVEIVPRYAVLPIYKVRFIGENHALQFSSEYAASFFLAEVKELIK